MASTLNRRVLAGFRLNLGGTLLYISVLVLIPLAACFLKAATLSPSTFWAAVSSERAQSAFQLTFGASLAAALVDLVLGMLIAWVLVRYEFPGKTIFDSLIDLPLALPTAVAGLVYSSLYVENGWLGQYLVPLGFQFAYTRSAIVLVLAFVGLPLVVRTLQPVLEGIGGELEEAAASLGATRWQTFRWVLVPMLLPALVTGFALSFARALGEYGSVVFVSGNMPNRTEIAPVLIVARLEEFAYAEATAVAVTLLLMSLSMLAVIQTLESWTHRHEG